MDSFLNLAQQGISAYGKSQSGSNRPDDRDDGHGKGGSGKGDKEQGFFKTGGEEYNSPHHRSGDGGQNQSYFNVEEVVKKASSEGSGDSSVFSSALAHIQSNPNKHQEPIDEEAAADAHRKIYSEGKSEGLSASSIGSAAALQVLKQFTGSNKQGSQSDLISLAMAEASKLFDSSGGSSHGNKQDAVNSAGLTIMKLLVQSKLGGGGGGGAGGFMSLASKFM